jgi:uncharacterized protein (TIGR02453 family)
MTSVLNFLGELEKNNNREWFNANKDRYIKSKEEYEGFIDNLIPELQMIDPLVAGATAKNSVFRIYRDVRFSQDKSPYKTHLGAYIIGGGRKSKLPGYYFHVQPGGSFIAGGMYAPDPESLKKIRKEISLFPEDIEAIIKARDFAQNLSFYEEDKLKRPPQGYSEDTGQIELIKNKHFIASRNIPDEWITSPDLKTRLLEICGWMHPFNQFLYRAIAD